MNIIMSKQFDKTKKAVIDQLAVIAGIDRAILDAQNEIGQLDAEAAQATEQRQAAILAQAEAELSGAAYAAPLDDPAVETQNPRRAIVSAKLNVLNRRRNDAASTLETLRQEARRVAYGEAEKDFAAAGERYNAAFEAVRVALVDMLTSAHQANQIDTHQAGRMVGESQTLVANIGGLEAGTYPPKQPRWTDPFLKAQSFIVPPEALNRLAIP